MRLSALAASVVLGVGCAAGQPAVVNAPGTAASSAPAGQASSGDADEPPTVEAACAKPWRIDVMGGDAHVVLVCPHDVRRASLDEAPVFASALSPALDPARDRVCGCAGKVQPPPFIDLVFTAHPADGRVTVEAKMDDENEPQLAPAFVACVGTLTATYDPLKSDVCPDGPPSIVYPVRLDLAAPRQVDPRVTRADVSFPP